MGQIRIGISGWRYGSFYALQRPESYRTWSAQTPPDFLFSVKGGRYVTHMLRLAGAEQALANFFASGVLALEEKLGPFLWQLSATLQYDPDRLAAFFDLLPRTTTEAVRLASTHDAKVEGRAWARTGADRPLRHVLEVRHPSYEVPGFAALLRQHGIGLVVADTAGRWPFLTEVTTDLVYVRLHGDTELYVSGYVDDALDRWAARVRAWSDAGHDVLVYFDNDVKVRAPVDAQRLADLLDVGPSGDGT